MENHFKAICGSDLWNNKTVYAKHPDLTFCFQYTLLLWIPCALLWCAAPLWTFMLTKSNPFKIKISWKLISKTVNEKFIFLILF